MQLVIGFIDHIPRKDLAAVVTDYGLNVIFKNVSKLGGRKFSISQPFWILMMPYQCVAANPHAVPDRKIDDLVRLRKIERLALRMHILPLKGVFRFQHGRIGGFEELRRSDCRPDKPASGTSRRLTQ